MLNFSFIVLLLATQNVLLSVFAILTVMSIIMVTVAALLLLGNSTLCKNLCICISSLPIYFSLFLSLSPSLCPSLYLPLSLSLTHTHRDEHHHGQCDGSITSRQFYSL